jgi:hypothetical protein
VDVGRGMDSRLDLASWGRVGVRMWEEEVRCFDRVLHSPPFWFVMWEQKQSAASAVVVIDAYHVLPDSTVTVARTTQPAS